MAMEMDHSFTVPVPPDRAWDVLLDVKRIAPCMPGATVDDFDGKVIVLEASGKETRGAGTASATVRATLEPESGGEATKASMHTTMNVTGRPAQFGRGVMVEVGSKLVEQFAQNLRQLIADDAGAGGGTPAATGEEASPGQATAAPETGATGPGSTQPSATIPAAATPTATAPPAPAGDDSINLVKLVGPAILKRAVP